MVFKRLIHGTPGNCSPSIPIGRFWRAARQARCPWDMEGKNGFIITWWPGKGRGKGYSFYLRKWIGGGWDGGSPQEPGIRIRKVLQLCWHRYRLGRTFLIRMPGGRSPHRKRGMGCAENKLKLRVCFPRSPYLFFYPAHCLAMFANFVNSGLHTKLTVPMGPFLCFAIITSAIFGISVSLL